MRGRPRNTRRGNGSDYEAMMKEKFGKDLTPHRVKSCRGGSRIRPFLLPITKYKSVKNYFTSTHKVSKMAAFSGVRDLSQ
jgi:hypothetical protein